MPASLEEAAAATDLSPAATDPALATHGYACARGVLDAAEVAALRAAAEAEFAAHPDGVPVTADCGRVLIDLFRHPALYRHLFQPRLLQALRRLVGGSVVLLPEHSVHREGFGGWHKDTDMFERAGLLHHWQPDYAVWQCAVYLQDNQADAGGGLSVLPGSHREPRPRTTLVDAAARATWIAARPQQLIDSRAGDLVVFDSRIDHRATPRSVTAIAPGSGPGALPAKLALFFMAARDNRHVPFYTGFIGRRADYAYLRDYAVPADAAAAAAAAGMRFVA